jgi:hypothetical protein
MPRPRKVRYSRPAAQSTEDFGGDQFLQRVADIPHLLPVGEASKIAGCSRNRLFERFELHCYCPERGRPGVSPFELAQAIYATRRRMRQPARPRR